MRCINILFVVFALFFLYSSTNAEEVSSAAEEVIVPEDDHPAAIPAVHHFRQKRATCDILSIFNVNHAACAMHCIGHGYRGGYCSDKAVCTCRR